jgi:predicted MPP superfamily phosphohydrolase
MSSDTIILKTTAKSILVFSDTHLTKSFDQKKFDFLYKIINESDLVIINGDFWDSWFCSFEDFINSKWNTLFPKLLEKNAVYIYGNHDQVNNCNDNVNLFSKFASDSLNFTCSNLTFRIEHGHKLTASKRGPLIEFYGNLLTLTKQWGIEKTTHKFIHSLEILGRYIFGYKILHENKIGRNSNNLMKGNYPEMFLICGDTHFPELDINNNYGNAGAIIYGFASYIVIENGFPRLVKTSYS